MGQVITANRLTDGIVVFVGPDAAWVETIGAAKVYDSPAAVAEGLAGTKKDEENNLVLDVYAVEVTSKDGAVVPVRLREAIRAQGPTVLPHHGKPLPSTRSR